MSTSETTHSAIGNCPCGNGKIIESYTTQDNPWSSADIGFSIVRPATANGKFETGVLR
jgi:hypothetical protein